MKKFGLGLVILSMMACSTFPRGEITGAPIDPRVRAEQEGQVQKGFDTLDSRDFPLAEKQFADFQTKFPNSVYYQKAQFGLAQSLEGQGRWAEAAELYRKTLELTRERQPDLAAQALFELSNCYENLGDEARVLASLNDAMLMKDHLLPEQALAEVPARLAASYNRMGRTHDAQIQFQKAEQGLQELRAVKKQDVSPSWLAKIYYQMGHLSTNQVALENLQASLDTLKMVQIFSLRAAEAEGQPWSQMAAQALIENYRDLWNTIQQVPLNKAMDVGAAKRERTERQVYFTGQLLALMNDLKLYKMPEAKADADEIFTFLTKLEKQGQDLLLSRGAINQLTPEAEKKEGLKRSGVTYGGDSTEEDKAAKSLPEKKIESDPNF